jgi:hypothetical protein
MQKINKNETGLTFGFLISSIHVIWSVLVAFGVAQGFMDFILKLHMINLPLTIMPFNFGYALGLIVVTFVIGYIFGWLMAYFWNKCFK